MPRLKEETKKEITALIKSGKSLNYIAKSVGENKTTIYYYMRKINGKRCKPINLFLKDNELIGELIGLFAGDGYYAHDEKRHDYRIRIYFNSNESFLVEYYKDAFFKLCNKQPGVINGKSTILLQLHSKEFCKFILSYLLWSGKKTYTVNLKDKSLYKDRLFMKGFLRGLIDADGYVRKDRKEIYYGSVSSELFRDFIHGLDLFGFRYKTYLQKSNYSDFYKVRISGKEVDDFIQVIKPIKSNLRLNAATRI